jgi:branched-subunit amino acid transport protein
MTKLEIYLIIFCAALAAFAVRYLPMRVLERQRLAPWLERSLRYVPAATLAGFVFPALFLQNQKLALTLSNDRLIAGILAAIIAYYTRNVLVTVVSGLVVLWILQKF